MTRRFSAIENNMLCISDRLLYFASKRFRYPTNKIFYDVRFFWTYFLRTVRVSFSYLVVRRLKWDAGISSYVSSGECVGRVLHIRLHFSRGNFFSIQYIFILEYFYFSFYGVRISAALYHEEIASLRCAFRLQISAQKFVDFRHNINSCWHSGWNVLED